MAWYDNVVWREGMFLRPQHLQQHDRYLDHQMRIRGRLLERYSWGFRRLRLDPEQLALGVVAIVEAEGFFPDGTFFSIGDQGAQAPRLQLKAGERDCGLCLALAACGEGAPNGVAAEDGAITRYVAKEMTVIDSVDTGSPSATIEIGRLALKIMRTSDAENDYVTLPLAFVLDVTPDKQVLLDEDLVPPLLAVSAHPRAQQWLNDIANLVQQRANVVASRLADERQARSAEIVDYLMLQVLNRYDALFRHWQHAQPPHPEQFFVTLQTLAAELATYTNGERRAARTLGYDHDALHLSLQPLLRATRNALSQVFSQKAVALAIQERRFGMRVVPLADSSLLKDAIFVLAVSAELPADRLRQEFPARVKIGGVDQIRDLVNLQLPGVRLEGMNIVPRQIPFHTGYLYFQLERTPENWAHVEASGGFAMHVSGEFPGLQLEFWAVRG